MDVRGVLVIARDVVTLGLGTVGVIHEEWSSAPAKPALLVLYTGLLLGVAGSKALVALKAIVAAQSEVEKEAAVDVHVSTTGPPTPSPLQSSPE